MTATVTLPRPSGVPGPAPVPWADRRQFQSTVGTSASASYASGLIEGYDPTGAVCGRVEHLVQAFPWATVDDVAAELAHTLGPGWGALYRLWVHQGGCLCWEGWVSHSETGRIRSPGCLLHRREVPGDV